VHQRRWLQDVPWALAAKPSSGLSAQDAIQQLEHMFPGGQITPAPSPQQSRHVGGGTVQIGPRSRTILPLALCSVKVKARVCLAVSTFGPNSRVMR